MTLATLPCPTIPSRPTDKDYSLHLVTDPGKPRQEWTPEETELLKKIFQDPLNKMGISQIAQIFNRSRKSIERKKETLNLGSCRQAKRKQKPHLFYGTPTPGAALQIEAEFFALRQKGESLQPFLPFLTGQTEITPEPVVAPIASSNLEKANTPWTPWDLQCLSNYWKLRALGIEDICIFLRRTPEEVKIKAEEQGLTPKEMQTPTTKYRICTQWQIEADIVQKDLTSDEQHALAELTVTRLAHLCKNPQETRESEADARKEIDKLFEVQRHIFHRAIKSKAKKLANLFSNPAMIEEELTQVGQTALFDCLSKWNPSEGINFCRATVAQSFEREMQKWLRNSRLVRLPSGLIQEIIEERRRQNGLPEEDAGPQTENRKNSIQRYLYSVHPEQSSIPFAETYEDEEDTRYAQLNSGNEVNKARHNRIEPEHKSFTTPTIESENTMEILGKICLELPAEERYAFCNYHGIGEDGESIPTKNLRELAQETGVTPERIRQRILLAKEKMAKKLAKVGIRSIADAL